MAEQHLESKIKDIDQTHKPLVVLLKGPDGDSAMMETIIRTSALASLREQTTLFVISTPQAEATLLQPVRDSLRKASLPHVSKTDLPMVLVIGRDGMALKVLRGLVTAGEVRQCLLGGVAAFASQVEIGASKSADKPIKQGTVSLTEGKQVEGSPAPLQDPTPPQTPNLGLAGTASHLENAAKEEPAVASSSSPPESKQDLLPSAPLQLQVYLHEGQIIRAMFTGATLLQEVCSYLEQHSPDGIAPGYKLVSHHLRREFGLEDMAKSLHELGMASMTSLRLHDVQATTGGSHSGFGSFSVLSRLLQSVRQFIIRFLTQLGFGCERRDRSNQDDADASTAQQAAEPGQDDMRPNRANNQKETASQLLRKRNRQPGITHSIHDTQDDDSNKKPDGNSYWNGNSTQFDADE